MRRISSVLFFLFFSVVFSYGQSDVKTGETSTGQRVFPKPTHPAEFPGGSEELGKYLSKRLRYPSSLLKAGIFPPPIMASFTVNEKGGIQNVEIIKLHQEEYTRLEPYLVKIVSVLEKMPAWKPATNGNTAVASRHIIPVSIDIK